MLVSSRVLTHFEVGVGVGGSPVLIAKTFMSLFIVYWLKEREREHLSSASICVGGLCECVWYGGGAGHCVV